MGRSLFFPLVLLLATQAPGAEPGAAAQTFCNPLNLDYGPYNNGSRHGADPVIVLFKDRYWLFDSLDKPGYRVSDDLVHWKVVLFDEATLPSATREKEKDIVAPALYTDGNWLYYVPFGGKHILRTADPASGHWDDYAVMKGGFGDPDLFLDDDGKVYMVSGLSETSIVEMALPSFTEVGSRTRVLPFYKTVEDFAAANSPYGLHYGHKVYGRQNWDLPGTLDTSTLDLSATASGIPTEEGNWLNKYKGRYYLQDANPDTSCPWYSDSVWESDSVLGPYKLADYSPCSMKVGGFINSAGHSCLFQDRYGNYWRVTTMWVGNGFIRRIGLFPAGFDAQGRLFTRTELGDYPIRVPTEKYDAVRESLLAGWSVLSTGKACDASSSLPGHDPAAASDENVRTYWAAKTGDAGEWFRMDLGKSCAIDAVQVNFAEHECRNDPASEDYTAYRLLVSEDGTNWTVALDKAASTLATPHDYAPFTTPLRARYLKVVNVHAAKGGKFALRDLRVFGNGGGAPPVRVSAPAITRQEDARGVTFAWAPSPDADGYVIRYGVAPDALHLNLQVQGGKTGKLSVSCLNRDVKYFYRIDAYNDSGLIPGTPTSTAQ